MRADLRNSIARLRGATGATRADLLAERGTVAASHSSFSSRVLLAGGTTTTPGTEGNVAGEPLLLADFRLAAGSPFIDRGDPRAITAGERDLVGSPRSLDGDGNCVAVPDIGAFESPGASPALCTEAVRLTRLTMSKRRFRRRGRRAARFRYTLSEPATVRIRIERARAGRRVRRNGKRRCVRPTRQNRRRRRCTRYRFVARLSANEAAGRQSTRFSGRVRGRRLRPGRYRVRVRAIDAQGTESAERRITFRVGRR